MSLAPSPRGSEGRPKRRLERTLILWLLPAFLLAASGLALAQPDGPAEMLWVAGPPLVSIWIGVALLHGLLLLLRFDGDELILPLLGVLFLIGGAYHLDLRGGASVGIQPGAYFVGVTTCLAALGIQVALRKHFQTAARWIEQHVWWRFVGDRPYYPSLPFHLLIGLGMIVVAAMLLVGGVKSDGGSLVHVRLPLIGGFTPSEVIRLAMAFFLADYLGRNAGALNRLREPLGSNWPFNRLYLEAKVELTVVLAGTGLYLLFFYAFRDFGPAAVLVLLTLVTLYAATGRALTPSLIGGALALGVAIPTWKHLAFHTFADRVAMWLNPWDTHFPNGDHGARILWSIATGGWLGMGAGTVNLPSLLPLARNDCSFAGIAALFGFWVALLVLGAFAGLTWRGLAIAQRAPTDRSRLLAFSLTSLLGIQAIWISGAMVRAFPMTGINLPFVSTGLTSLVVSTIALGTIWNLSCTIDRPDASEATVEVQESIRKVGRPLLYAFLIPAVGVVLYGCPWILGDRTLTQRARALDQARRRFEFSNPYLELFKQRLTRGRVLSADGQLLAVSAPDPAAIDEIRKVSPSVARYAERETLGPDERVYSAGPAAAHLVGWTTRGRFSAQAASVETSADSLLRGYKPSELPFYFRTRHNPLVRQPSPHDLQLTVRLDLQRKAYDRLREAVRRAGGRGGALLVYDAFTGEVLTAVTAPSIDPNGLTLATMQQYVRENPQTQVLVNKPLSRDALYFPGSTFKILTAATMLQHEITGAARCAGGRNSSDITWSFGGKRYRQAAGRIRDFALGGHGLLDFATDLDRALVQSCNVFFAKAAATLGPELIRGTMQAAEFRVTPGAATMAEHLPFVGFGQIDPKVSPIEMAMVSAAISVARTEGEAATAARPHWIQAELVRDGGKVTRKEPEGVLGTPDRKPYAPFAEPVARRLRDMLVQVVESPGGTAHDAFFPRGVDALPGITVGGKTGTAEFEKRGKSIGRHAWFTGFARSDHEAEPRTLAYAALIEDVRRGATGGNSCAPLVRDVLADILPLPGEDRTVPFFDPERLYRDQVRPRLGPLGPAVDWLRRLFGRR